MKFIFPRNYNFKNKLFGIFDYNTIIFNIIWDVFIFCLINLIFEDVTTKAIIFIICCFPLLLFSIVGFQHESILSFITYLLKFLFSNKVYLFNKF